LEIRLPATGQQLSLKARAAPPKCSPKARDSNTASSSGDSAELLLPDDGELDLLQEDSLLDLDCTNQLGPALRDDLESGVLAQRVEEGSADDDADLGVTNRLGPSLQEAPCASLDGKDCAADVNALLEYAALPEDEDDDGDDLGVTNHLGVEGSPAVESQAATGCQLPASCGSTTADRAGAEATPTTRGRMASAASATAETRWTVPVFSGRCFFESPLS